MTAERDNCSLTSILPISCRDRAEAFARTLQSRLSSLGSQSNSTDECNWLGSHNDTVALTQPTNNPETEKYLALDTLGSPCSPPGECEESELHPLNSEDLRDQTTRCYYTQVNSDTQCLPNELIRHYSGDSDNEVFYDIDDYPPYLHDANTTNNVERQGNVDVDLQFGIESDTSESLDYRESISDEASMFSLTDGDSNSMICNECGTRTEANAVNEIKNSETTFPSNDNGFMHCETSTDKNDSDTYINIEVPHNRRDQERHNEDATIDHIKLCSVSDANNAEEDDDSIIPRVRRCTSLKTGKTPPGTPGRKKIVRFADVLGLDLADVKTFIDEIPKVPKSAYDDLSNADLSDMPDSNIVLSNKFYGMKTEKILMPLFEQPSGCPDFLDMIRENYVCLENALVDDPTLFSIKGTVRVRNLDFHKSVHVRYSLDSWKTFADVQASYVDNSCDGFSDRFSFTIYAHTLMVGQKLEFACRFQCRGFQYWDNNKANNYCFQCIPTAPTQVMNHDHPDWGASFY